MKTKKKTEARPFTDSDWDGFAGATGWYLDSVLPARSKHRPVVREIGTYLVIADSNGVQVFDTDLTDDGFFLLPGVVFPCQAPALAFLNGLPDKGFNLDDYGFVPST